jgi:ABC-type transport system substrate-binding protein
MEQVIKTQRMGSTGRFPCLAALLFLALNAGACAPADKALTPPPATQVTLTVGYSHQTGENPLHGVQAASRLLSFEGLSYLARDGQPQPRLAESWAESLDGLTWTIKIRKNAFFHDGSRVDASAVRASLERSLANGEGNLRPGLSDIVAVEATADDTILIRLRSRSTFLLDDLTVSIVKVSGGSQFGTGPFVTRATSTSQVVMSAVTNYHRGKPAIDQIVWKAYPAVRTAWAAMMRGEIDFLYEVSPDTLEFIQSESSVQVFPFLRNYVHGVFFNSSRPIFKDTQVRRALNHAVDRMTLIDQVFRGKGVPANGPAWPLHWAYDAFLPPYTFDPSKAAALLDSANLPKTPLRTEPGKVPGRVQFVCLLPENFEMWERMALMVQRDLSRIGVDMQIESVSFADFNKRVGERDFDAVMVEMIAGNSISRPYLFWHSQSKLNTWGYQNPHLDRALDEIRRASSESEYRSAFRRFQVQIFDDAPAIFLALGNVTRAVNRRFQVVAPPDTDILPTIADWRPAEDAARMTN